MRTPEIATIDMLNEKIEQRDDNISRLEKKLAKKEQLNCSLKDERVNAEEALDRTIKEKEAMISELKEENANLRLDLARQADKIKAFEGLKTFMKSTLDLEASGKK